MRLLMTPAGRPDQPARSLTSYTVKLVEHATSDVRTPELGVVQAWLDPPLGVRWTRA